MGASCCGAVPLGAPAQTDPKAQPEKASTPAQECADEVPLKEGRTVHEEEQRQALCEPHTLTQCEGEVGKAVEGEGKEVIPTVPSRATGGFAVPLGACEVLPAAQPHQRSMVLGKEENGILDASVSDGAQELFKEMVQSDEVGRQTTTPQVPTSATSILTQ